MTLETVPTVKIKAEATTDNPNGYIVINESDFNKDEHELFDAPAKAAEPAAPVATPVPQAAEPAPAPVVESVAKPTEEPTAPVQPWNVTAQ
jgi:hypothetical protein